MTNNNLKWEEFSKVDIRVGTIIKATEFPEANNPSYILQIDFDSLGILKSSAQITENYKKEGLIGKQILAVVNFPSKQIANMKSECLVLGAVDEKKGIFLVSPDHKVHNGTKIS